MTIMSATNREGGGVGSRVGSGQALRGSGRVRSLALEVGSGPDPGGSGRVRKIGPGNTSGYSSHAGSLRDIAPILPD